MTNENEKYIPVKTIRIGQAVDRYNKSRRIVVECAKDAHAYIQIGKICLVEVEKMDSYMEYKYKSGEEYGFYRVFNKLNCKYDFEPEYIEWLKEIYKLYLTDTEQEIISRLCGIYHEMETGSICAESLSISTQRIYQIRDKAFRKIRYRAYEYYKFKQFKELDLHLNTITLLKALSIDNTTLSARANNVLFQSGYAKNVYDLIQLNIKENDLKQIRNCGVKTLNEILEYQKSIKYLFESLFGIYNELEI